MIIACRMCPNYFCSDWHPNEELCWPCWRRIHRGPTLYERIRKALGR